MESHRFGLKSALIHGNSRYILCLHFAVQHSPSGLGDKLLAFVVGAVAFGYVTDQCLCKIILSARADLPSLWKLEMSAKLVIGCAKYDAVENWNCH